jgi:hypothetical protein
MRLCLILLSISLTACGSLEKKTILINAGDGKNDVLKIMGAPDDRQLKGSDEAWQYCQTGAGFGYHDYRTIWFSEGKVTGVTSYKSSRAASSCTTDIKQINWHEAPDAVVEFRSR